MKNSNIVDRVVERMKTQPLGDLIQEEDLYDIIKEAIPKTFFEPVVHKTSSYNEVTKEPVIYTIMRETLSEHVKTAVDEWFNQNQELIAKKWNEILDKNIVEYVEKIQNEKVNSSVRNALQPWVDQLNNERMRMGLPGIYI